MPARVSFDASEQAGVFDKDDAGIPGGAFKDTATFHSNQSDGTFPVARDGKWVFVADVPVAPGAPPTPTYNRGAVLALDPSAEAPREPFYPDPAAAEVCARFTRNGDPAKKFRLLETPAAFWRDDPSDAVPVALELRGPRGAEQNDADYGWFAKEPETQIQQIGGSRLAVQRISMVLKPAEDVEVELWPHVQQHQGCTHNTIAKALRLLSTQGTETIAEAAEACGLHNGAVAPFAQAIRSLVAMDEAGRKTLHSVLCLGPISQLSSKRTVRVVHAVDRPLATPAFTLVEKDPPQDTTLVPELKAVVLTVEPEPQPGETVSRERRTWSRFARVNNALPRLAWQSEPNGTTTFIVGSVRLDRPSTGKLRCDAEWREFEPAGVRRDPITKQWTFTHRNVPRTRLFGIDEIATTGERESRLPTLDLVKHDGVNEPIRANQLRALSYSFPDGKARRLCVSLVGTSRFTSFFPEESADDQRKLAGLPGRYESESARLELWVPATIRGRHPDIDRIMPVFQWNTSPPKFLQAKFTWQRKAGCRLYMNRDTWHSTGEGEKLAVAFGPFKDKDGKELDLCGFESAVGEFATFITRWGADPIHPSGTLADLMPASQIVGGTEHPNLQLPYAFEPVVKQVLTPCPIGDTLPANYKIIVAGENFIPGATATVNGFATLKVIVETSAQATIELSRETSCPLIVQMFNPALTVSIKAFEPKVEPAEGLWYVDLPINPGNAYFPFVQLGLARYQPHCAPNLHLSPPRTAWVQVLPERNGSVTIEKDRRIVIEHRGIGYRIAKAGGETDTPRLHLRVMRTSSPGRLPYHSDGRVAWMPALRNGAPVQKLNCVPFENEGEVWWCEELMLPPTLPGVRYGLQIEEVELMPADPDPVTQPGEWVYGDDGNLTVKPVDSEHGPVFLHVIDLGN